MTQRKRLIRAAKSIGVVGVLAVAIASLGTPHETAAQWVDYPTANVPRNADGHAEPRRARAARGRWQARSIGHLVVRRAVARVQREGLHPQMNLPADQINIGRTLKAGLPYQPWAAQLVAERTANGAKDDPHAFCLPPNFPRAYSLPQYLKIAQMPKLTIMLHEFNASYRQIFTDGRPLPKDPLPAWSGYSTAHWEGQHVRYRVERFSRRFVARPLR
jgi:hypothetical protein